MRSLSVPIAGPTRTCNASGCRLFAGATISMASPTSTEPVTLKATTRPAMLELVTYEPPSWAQQLQSKPTHFYNLGQLPTIIHRWKLPGLPSGTEVWIKRDDLSGMQLSGNKVRKLEFLMADAKAQGADCVITLGGIQSNHCRATAVAARYLDLDSYLILRTSKSLLQEDPGLAGNLLVERLVGANIELVSKEEYTLLGSVALGELLAERLKASGRKPYVIPVGGSNSLGTWGYIQAVKEIEDQLKSGEAGGAAYFDDFVMACGSGGTTAGMSLAVHLASLKTKVHAYSVCDDPNYFYEYIQGLLDGLDSGVKSPDIVRISDAKGIGYGFSTAEELETVKRIAEATGIILDPVYSGKAVNAMLRDMEKNPSAWEGRKVLFWHTGGLLGLYDKIHQLQPMIGKWQRLLPEDNVA